MSEVQVQHLVQAVQNEEKVFPIFYKKKTLSLEKTKELQEITKDVMEDNDQIIENEKLMLNKIRMKHKSFLSRLEAHLKNFKKTNVQKIVLELDMLPVWSSQGESATGNIREVDDAAERLNTWYKIMELHLFSQYQETDRIINDWFVHLDKIDSEGESDPQSSDIDSDLVSENSTDSVAWSENAFWYITLILFCLVNMVIFFFKPEDINQCIDNGFHKCFTNPMMKISVFVHDHYLKFHNITQIYQSIPSENSSVEGTVQHSLDVIL